MLQIDEYEIEFAERQKEEEKSLMYRGRILNSSLAFWQKCKDLESKYKWEEGRGRETLRHFFANLPEARRNRAVDERWDERTLTPLQLRLLKKQFLEYGLYLIQSDITMLEAEMLFAWVEDFDNLDKKPLFDFDYAFPFSHDENMEGQEVEDYMRNGCMNEPSYVYQPGTIACIEQFTYGVEELRMYVIYTYYNKDEQPLYIGCSKSFYNAHYFNQERLSFADEIKYVGFVFFENESHMKDARKYFIKARNPIYNQRKCKNVLLLEGLDISCDHLVVRVDEMEKRWREFLVDDVEEIE